MEFYQLAGKMALGSRLRRLADVLMSDAERIYRLYDVGLDPRWFPVFYMLTVKESAGITEIAEDIGQTHPSVSQVVRSMMKAGLVTTEKCKDDARVSRVALTQAGKETASKLSLQCEDVNVAVGEMFNAAGSQLWSELEAIEHEIEKAPLYERVRDVRKAREHRNIQVVPYRPKYKKAFRDLNIAWIEKHWEMEPSDYKALDNPTTNIINTGGYIAIALYKQKPAGTCALMKMDNHRFELAKMAVSEEFQGMGVGSLLVDHMIAKTKEMGGNKIYLESNTVLAPAINLYRKSGFKRISGKESPYKRCNIQMEMTL